MVKLLRMDFRMKETLIKGNTADHFSSGRTHYADQIDFKISAVHENGKLSHFIVVDRNNELAINKKFKTASDAIEAGHEKFKGLV